VSNAEFGVVIFLASANVMENDRPEQAKVYFFNNPGAHNTPKVIYAIRQRIRLKDISKILVASESGRLALKIARAITGAKIVCVTYEENTRLKYQKPALMKDSLAQHEIAVVDTVAEPLCRELTFRNWWEGKTINLLGPSADLFWMTLICVGGHGFRTAVQNVFMAVKAGAVGEGDRVVSVAGTGYGADSAIVMKASKFEDAVGVCPEKRMKVEEILAMPKRTVWEGYG
jgi:hypothetical protein